MAKQRKQKQGSPGGAATEATEASGGGGDEPSVSVRHQRLCLVVDMQEQRVFGYTELQVVNRKASSLELHAPGLNLTEVLLDNSAASYQRIQAGTKTPIRHVHSSREAADVVRSRYTAALEEEIGPDLIISLPRPPEKETETRPEPASENGEAPPDEPGTASKAPTPAEEVKLLKIEYSIDDSYSAKLFKDGIFHTNHLEFWFPCLGSKSNKCSYHLEFTVNCSYTAVSAGNLLYQIVCKEDARMKTCVYELKVPTHASFIKLVVAPLVVLPERQHAGVRHMCPPGHVSKLQSTVSCFHSLFSLFEEYLGSSFPFGCYKQVFLESEHLITSVSVGASLVVFGTHLLVDEKTIDQAIVTQIKFASALAQQWFGVFITPETDRDEWLLQGISGFLVHLFIKKFLGNNEAQFRRFKVIGAVTVADIDSAAPLSPASVSPAAYRADKLGLVGKLRFLKAVAVIQMLEKQMGADHFRKVLQRIILRAQDPSRNLRSLSTKEFRHFASRVGNMERNVVKEFFPRWVECQGCPVLRMGFEYNKRRNFVEFAVRRECTAPGVVIRGKAGSKRIADVGWPVMMTIQVHELDGVHDHPNLSLSGDVCQLLELPCYSKLANRRPPRPKKSGKVEIIDDLADDKPCVESPLVWIRADPALDYLAKIILKQPEQMWINQLEKDKDVIAQVQAIAALRTFPNSFAIVAALNNCLIDAKVFCRARIEAAFALAATAGEATSWAGLTHLTKFYRSRCFDTDTGLPKPNNFHDFAEYFVLQAIPLAVATVRGSQGVSPADAVDFILCILKHNDNSSNLYSDSFWLSAIIEAVGELEVHQESMDKLAKILKQIDRYLQYDRLMPSYNYLVTRSCIHTITRLTLKFSSILSMEPVEQLLAPFRNMQTPWQIRVSARQAGLDLKYQSEGLDKAIRLAIAYVQEEPCLKVQTKVMSHLSSIILTNNVRSRNVHDSTLLQLLQLFESEYCKSNLILRHYVFTILQVLAGRPASLMSKFSVAEAKNHTGGVAQVTKVPKKELKVRIPKPQESIPILKLSIPTASSAAPKVGKVKLRIASATPTQEAPLSKWAEESPLAKVVPSTVNDAVDAMEVDEIQVKNVTEVISIGAVEEGQAQANVQAQDNVEASLNQVEVKNRESKEKHKKDKKEKKEKKDKKDKNKDRDRDKEKKEKKDKKEKKEKKDKKHKDKKHKEEDKPEEDQQKLTSQLPQREPNQLMQVKQEISEAGTKLESEQSAPTAPAAVAPVTSVKRTSDAPVYRLKIKRPKVD